MINKNSLVSDRSINTPLIFMLLLLSLSPFHSFIAQESNKELVVQEPELAREISEMRDYDQKLRKQWAGMIKKGKTDSKKFKDTSTLLLNTDRSNTARMKEIIKEYGWPTYDIVGERASRSAWLLVQHADRDPLFQADCLPLLKEAMDNGQARPSNYAYLYDRVQVAFGEKQLYATQSSSNNGLWEGQFYPLEDESLVQVRRDEMGIDGHVEAYASSMGFEYKVPTKEEAIIRADSLAKAYKKNVDLAKKAMVHQNYDQAIEHYELAIQCNGSVKSEDFVQLARALSISEHEKVGKGFYYLVKAAIRIWEGINEFDTDPDLAFLKSETPENWKDLMTLVNDVNRRRTAKTSDQ